MSARSLNRVMLIGNLTRDPEVKYTPSGTAVCTFGLATNRSWTTSEGGEAQEETEYHRIVAWSKLAEICGQLLFKGRKVYCEGRLQTRKWTGKDGMERTSTEVVIDNMIALSPPKSGYPGDEDYDGNQGGYESQISETSQTPVTAQAAPISEAPKKDEVDVDDIPF